jgi:hypothetical protein
MHSLHKCMTGHIFPLATFFHMVVQGDDADALKEKFMIT